MKKKSRGIIVGLFLSVVLLILLFIFGRYMKIWNLFLPKDQELGTYEEAINVINEKEPTDVFLYGEDMVITDSINYTKVKELSDSVLNEKKRKVLLIINDMNGTVSLNEDEWKFLQEKKKDYDFYFYYAGRNLLSEFEKRKILSDIQEDDLCTGIVTCEGKRSEFVVFNKEDMKVADKKNNMEMLSEFIFENVAYCYASNN